MQENRASFVEPPPRNVHERERKSAFVTCRFAEPSGHRVLTSIVSRITWKDRSEEVQIERECHRVTESNTVCCFHFSISMSSLGQMDSIWNTECSVGSPSVMQFVNHRCGDYVAFLEDNNLSHDKIVIS